MSSHSNNMKRQTNSMWSDRNIWECEYHPGCLVSIPCECKNCQRYTKLLELRVNASQQEKTSRVSEYLDCHCYQGN